MDLVNFIYELTLDLFPNFDYRICFAISFVSGSITLWILIKDPDIEQTYNSFIYELKRIFGSDATNVIEILLKIIFVPLFVVLFISLFVIVTILITGWTLNNIGNLGWWNPVMFGFLYVVVVWGWVIYGILGVILGIFA